MRIDINCDMGESYGHYKIGHDLSLMDYISSCNIACGYHAGDPVVMQETVNQAAKKGLGIGAHPSYPDLQGFGRRSMKIPTEELSAMIRYQVYALKGFVEMAGSKLHHIKPHGALYNDIAKSEELSNMIADLVLNISPEITLVGLAGSVTEKVCSSQKIKFRGEFFADRNYDNEGYLVSRTKENAVISNPEQIAERTLRFAKTGEVRSIENTPLKLNATTICIHGDHHNSLATAKAIYKTLTLSGISINHE
ncbi:MAG: 5-oxoprolinase subunit PxpA [Bacteroidota bacterium]